MRFPVYFKRAKAVSGIPTLGTGTDPIPTFASTKLDYTSGNAPNDNVLSHKLQRPMNRVALGWWYEGVGSAPATLPVTIWVWDEVSEKWYEASSGTLVNGQITYLKCLALADPPQTVANLGQPQHGIDVLIIIGDNSGDDGTYHFVAGPDSAFA